MFKEVGRAWRWKKKENVNLPGNMVHRNQSQTVPVIYRALGRLLFVTFHSQPPWDEGFLLLYYQKRLGAEQLNRVGQLAWYLTHVFFTVSQGLVHDVIPAEAILFPNCLY